MQMNSNNLIALEKNTQAVYERQAQRFDQERSKVLFEKQWLDRFVQLLSPGAKILDVGCGAGEPIARYFIEKGYDLTGLDFSRSMLEIARTRFPDSTWHYMDMRQLHLQDRFDGIIAWHSFFHLKREDQKSTLQNFAEHLRPGAVLMLTVGYEDGEVLGHVGGEEVYHASFAYETYEALLNDLGLSVLRFVNDDPDCRGASVLLAQKSSVPDS